MASRLGDAVLRVSYHFVLLRREFVTLNGGTRYTSTISLSLYIFNLLALPFLDGSQFLHVLLDFVHGRRSIDTRAGDGVELVTHNVDLEPDLEPGLGDDFEERSSRDMTWSGSLVEHRSRRHGVWSHRWRPTITALTVERSIKHVTSVLSALVVLGTFWSQWTKLA